MESYSKNLEVRWAELDPDFHVLHSKYYDFGAYCRMSFLTEHGMTSDLMVGIKLIRSFSGRNVYLKEK